MQMPIMTPRPKLMIDQQTGDVHLQGDVEYDQWRQSSDRAEKLKWILDVLEHVDAQQRIKCPGRSCEIFAVERKALTGVLCGHPYRLGCDIEAGISGRVWKSRLQLRENSP